MSRSAVQFAAAKAAGKGNLGPDRIYMKTATAAPPGAPGADHKGRIDFNSLVPPPGYVPGLGRGATGFQSRGDQGPALIKAPGAPPGGLRPGGAGKDAGAGGGDDAAGAGAGPTGPFDAFEGAEAGLFGSGVYDDDDAEADAIWDGVETARDAPSAKRRAARLAAEVAERRATRGGALVERFSDLKRGLKAVSRAEWEAMPDTGDRTVKRRRRWEREGPGSDALLAQAAGLAGGGGISATEVSVSRGGGSGTATSLAAGRSKVLALDLDRAARARTAAMGGGGGGAGDGTSTAVDPRGYLTSMASTPIASGAEVADLKKARALFKSVVASHPTNASGWIGAARLEERAGKTADARALMLKGCEACPRSEDAWLEAARLARSAGLDAARAVLARAAGAVPNSVAVWLRAAELEKDDPEAHNRVLRRALETVPTSVALWKSAVDAAASPSDARVLLARAVECCPREPDLWLALARLETHAQARKVLNRARKALPADRSVWLAAAKLEEAHGQVDAPDALLPRALKALKAAGAPSGDREGWLTEAKAAEEEGCPRTCRAVVRATARLDVEPEDRAATWSADARDAARAGRGSTARALWEVAVEEFPDRADLWRGAADLEREEALGGTAENEEELLAKACAHLPREPDLWLRRARSAWRRRGDLAAARAILEEASEAAPDCEDVYLAAARLEMGAGRPGVARRILEAARGREATSSPRVWTVLATLLRARTAARVANVSGARPVADDGDDVMSDDPLPACRAAGEAEERAHLTAATARHSSEPKLWLMLAQLEERAARAAAAADRNAAAAAVDVSVARRVLARAVAACPGRVAVWRAYASLETRVGDVGRARAILAAGRARLAAARDTDTNVAAAAAGDPRDDPALLWVAASRVERCPPPNGAGDAAAADRLIDRGLQENPASGPLWAEAVLTCPKQQRKSRGAEALSRAGDACPEVVEAVGRLFFRERRHDKARAWLRRACGAAPLRGDAWAALYKLECLTGGGATGEAGATGTDGEPATGEGCAAAREVADACARARPRRGDRWEDAARGPAVRGEWTGKTNDDQASSAPDDAASPWVGERSARAVLRDVALALDAPPPV